MRLILVAEASIANGFNNSTRLEGVVEEVVVVGGVLVRDCLDHLKKNEVDYESTLSKSEKKPLGPKCLQRLPPQAPTRQTADLWEHSVENRQLLGNIQCAGSPSISSGILDVGTASFVRVVSLSCCSFLRSSSLKQGYQEWWEQNQPCRRPRVVTHLRLEGKEDVQQEEAGVHPTDPLRIELAAPVHLDFQSCLHIQC